MTIYTKNVQSKQQLQPGARGEMFKANMPGYRDGEDRLNRTNHRLNTNAHDTTNIKYSFDDRLKPLFRYGYAWGYNQMVIPKGRIVAVDQYRDIVDFDFQKNHNTLTLANGGAPVRLRKSTDLYKDYKNQAQKLVSTEAQKSALANADKEFTPVIGQEKAYDDVCYRPFAEKGPVAQLTDNNMKIDPVKGIVTDNNGAEKYDVIPGNHPIGIITRNEYTRDEDAFNGIMPGAVDTDCMVELPWFAYKDKAESNPWGSAYGPLFPGCIVKSDENGRFVPSPLNYETLLDKMQIKEYELERQQAIGQVYSVSNDLVPEGAAKWATWALSDRLNFNEINPDVWPANNRKGEDIMSHSPYASEGKYPGYPYDKTYGANDIHMIGPGRTNYDLRMQEEYRLDRGIPGLTDGYNAYCGSYGPYEIGGFRLVNNMDTAIPLTFKLPEVTVENMEIAIGSKSDDKFAPITEGALLKCISGANEANDFLEVIYADEQKGMFQLKIKDLTKANTYAAKVVTGGAKDAILPIYVRFKKRGLAGVPTFMDWDGCVGAVKILLQK